MMTRALAAVGCLFLLETFAIAGSPPYYIGEILPTPKRAAYQDAFIPVYDIAGRRPLAEVIAGPSTAEQLAAKDFIARVCELAGPEAPNHSALSSWPKGYAPKPADGPITEGNIICIGPPVSNAATGQLASRPGLTFTPAPKGEQGYLIRTAKDGERFICIAGGGGPMGTYFAAMSLVQLLKVEGGQVLLRAATVDDWPTFEMRGTCCFTTEEAAWLGLAKFSTLDMNYNSVGVNAWRDPDAHAAPTGWGRYSGAGDLDVAGGNENPHGGKRCMSAAIRSYYKELKGKPDVISAALMLGETAGYKGDKALPASPGRYHLSAWMRGNVPEVRMEVTAWMGKEATGAQRKTVPVNPGSVKPTAEWRQYQFSFDLPAGAHTFAPKFQISGSRGEGFNIGDGFCVDDVVLTREGSAENLAPNGDVEGTGKQYSEKVAGLWDWAVPRGLWPVQYVNPLDVSGWEEDGKMKIQVSDPKQIDDLARTFRISLDRGGQWVMLALDDFASRLGGPAPYYIITNEADRKAFKSLGECHGVLARELYARLKETHPHVRMIVCPAYYWIPKGKYQEEGEKYLREFGRLVPQDVLILWTGPNVRSREITAEQVQHFTGLIGRKPYLWDNTIYARHKDPMYLLDPFDSKYPDRLWEMTAGGLHNNGGVSDVYKVGCLVYGDYAWNPEAYDPAKSLDKALGMVLGEGCAADANAFRENYYAVRDPHIGLTRDISGMKAEELVKAVGPLGREEVEKIVAQIGAMDTALARLKEKSPNKRFGLAHRPEHVEGPLLEALETYAAPLRASGAVLKKCGDLTALAIQRIEGGILLKDWAFVGGVGHEVYSNNCEPRRATWIYGKKTKTNKMTASFALDRAPETGVLVIEGQDTDKEGVTRVEIVLNGRPLYTGPNKCRKQGWAEWRIEVPQGVLKNGQNTLMIGNLEDTDSANAAWFMLSQAKVVWN